MKIQKIVKRFARSWLDLIYPPLCPHCQEVMESSVCLLCQSCSSLLQLLEIEGRCPYCFVEGAAPMCPSCKGHIPSWKAVASAFDYFGPPAALVRQLKYSGRAYFAEGLGAYLVAQLAQLDWPLPDVVVPVPMSRSRRLTREYNHSLLLAKAVAKLINRPVCNALCRRSGGFTQAGLNLSQRSKLHPKHYALAQPEAVANKSVLLIDDVLTSGTTLKCSAEALIGGSPREVYALTVCRAAV